MKKVLVTSYEGGQVFVYAPRNASKEDIFQAVRGYTQEKLERPVVTLSNYSYETESCWRERAEKDRDFELAINDIPVIRL